MTYREKLNSPQWARFRHQLIHARGCACEECHEPQSVVTLQVHHITYLRGMEPWEYPSDLVIVLCEQCHRDRQVHDEEAKAEFARLCGRLTTWQVYELSKRIREQNEAGFAWKPKFWDSFRSFSQGAERIPCK